MDLRVLAAVFITLFATAVGMAHGNLQVDDFMDPLKNLQRPGVDVPDLGSKPSNTSVHAEFSSTGSFSAHAGEPSTLVLEVVQGTRITVGDSRIQSEGERNVTIHGFTGSIESNPSNLTVQGTAELVSVGGLVFNYSSPKTVTIQAEDPDMKISGLESRSIVFRNATGTVRSGDTGVELDGENVVFHYFSGNIGIDSRGYILDGEVYKAEAGEVSIGG